MPSDPDQMGEIIAGYFDKRLLCSSHLHNATVLQDQPVAAHQRGRFGQVKQKCQSTLPGHRHAAAVAAVKIQLDPVDRLRAPTACWQNLARAQHQKRK